jgi:NitT/TauT family transport system substrate-binding protein
MRVTRTNAIRSILALLIGLVGAVCPGAGRAADEPRQPVAIQFSLDRPIDAVAAPFVMAATNGLFSAEGLAVTTNIASGSPDAIARVAAGTSDFALVDINALVRYRDKDKADTPRVKAVFVLFNKAPYAIIARKSRGISALPDLQGKTLGVAEGDLSAKLWPAVAKQNGIKLSTIKQSSISAAVREPMLSAGQVDAVTGFSYLSAVNLKDRGVPADDLVVLKFSDYGCEAYGGIEAGGGARLCPRGDRRHACHPQGAGQGRRPGGQQDGRWSARPRTGAAARHHPRQHPDL